MSFENMVMLIYRLSDQSRKNIGDGIRLVALHWCGGWEDLWTRTSLGWVGKQI